MHFSLPFLFRQVMLADFVSPSAIFYGTVVPLTVYNIARVLIVNPYLKQQKDKELKRKQEGQSEQLMRVKKEAQMAVELMTESVAKVVRDEEAKRGWPFRCGLLVNTFVFHPSIIICHPSVGPPLDRRNLAFRHFLAMYGYVY